MLRGQLECIGSRCRNNGDACGSIEARKERAACSAGFIRRICGKVSFLSHRRISQIGFNLRFVTALRRTEQPGEPTAFSALVRLGPDASVIEERFGP